MLQCKGLCEILFPMEVYIPVFVQICVAVGLGVLVIAASQIFGQRAKTNKVANSAYECGNKAEGGPHPRWGAKFYVVAMLFVIFDIEVVFLIPLAMVYSDLVAQKLPILLPVLFFIAALCAGLLYEIKKDTLNWNIPRSNR